MDKSGIILVDKKPGLTSFQTIQLTRKNLDIKKAGHTGTLDKFASGLLIAVVGKGTKLSSFFMDLEKNYTALIHLGRQTDTLDPEGTTVKTTDVPELKSIENVLPDFIGEVKQKPPIYSAIHINGTRAYKSARKGLAVEVPERTIRIKQIDILSFNENILEINVICSKGTYVRSLARDIAAAAGSCAFVSGLRRNAIGGFTTEKAVNADDAGISDIIPLQEALLRIPSFSVCTIYDSFTKDISNGLPIQKEWFADSAQIQLSQQENIAIQNEAGHLCAVVKKEGNEFRYIFTI